jgi:hypothetical protein
MSVNKPIDEFKNEIEQADWAALKDHQKRGALFIIDKNLKLEEVANAFARDFSSIVKIWLDSKEIQIVDEKMADDFAENEFEELARFLIVQPYVLMQLI